MSGATNVDQKLSTIDALSEAASPAPWKEHLEERDGFAGSDFIELPSHNDARGEFIDIVGATEADYIFIVCARETISRLVAEVRRLIGQRDAGPSLLQPTLLRDIRTLADEATPGPWIALSETDGYAALKKWGYSTHASFTDRDGTVRTIPQWAIKTGSGDLFGVFCGTRADLNFIAHARQDVPWLLDQIAKLQ